MLRVLPLLLLYIGFSAVAYDPLPMPLMVDPQVVQGKKPILNLKQRYLQAGQPKITFLINERLGSDSQQWQASQRMRISNNDYYTGIKEGEVNEGSAVSETIVALEDRIPSIKLDINSEGLSFLLSSFFSRIQEENIQVVDSQTILEMQKIARSDKNNPQHSLMLPAIRTYSDLLAEIYILEKKKYSIAQLRLIDIDSGALLAQKTASLDGVPDMEEQYQATNKGYRKVEIIAGCKDESSLRCKEMSNKNIVRGYQLADLFMHALAKGLE